MKEVLKNKIINIESTPLFDNKLLFKYLNSSFKSQDIEVFYLKDLLLKKENSQLLNNIKDKYAMYSNVYSEKDELEIFKNLFDYAISNNKKIHIIGITLDDEIKILENYYTSLGFLRDDINCFKVDFSIPLVTVSVNIENLIWRGSDYKSQKDKIFFIPPIREAGQTKAMFKGINRGVTMSIFIDKLSFDKVDFLRNCLINEHVLSQTLSKVLYYNLIDRGFDGEFEEIIFDI
ncbi:hypothetical protein H3C61_02055 [Candidatus Gracilibacteria bacterium]|nr:hypothetical protein [Candidatus Gracilibacteria bacterium]